MHLQPPIGANRIAIERFAPYFNDPALGFSDKTPSAFYPIVYGLPNAELEDMVFLFDSIPHGISGEIEDRLGSAFEVWISGHGESWLTLQQTQFGMIFCDRRKGWAERDILFTDPVECAAIFALEEPHSIPSLVRELEKEFGIVNDARIAALLSRQREDGLVYEDAGKFVLLATRYDASHIRMRHLESIANALRNPNALHIIRFVRDCVAVGIRVRWSVSHVGAIDPRLRTHLWPPTDLPGHGELLTHWRDFAFGVLYRRRGSDFAIIRDVRPGWEPSMTTLDGETFFNDLEAPHAVHALGGSCEAQALKSLKEARLFLAVDSSAVALPDRIFRWPVPYMAV